MLIHIFKNFRIYLTTKKSREATNFKVQNDSMVILTKDKKVYLCSLNIKDELVANENNKAKQLRDTFGDKINITNVFSCDMFSDFFIKKYTKTIYINGCKIKISDEFVDYDRILYFSDVKNNITQSLLVLYNRFYDISRL